MLKLENVHAHYGDLQVLWDISLEVREGEIVALIGSNGAGKTTLIRTISGLHRPSHGNILYNGILLNHLSPHKIVKLGISMVPEGRRLFPKMSVMGNLEMGAFLREARQEKDKTLIWIYEIFPILRERSNQIAGSLSGGEQQMLAIARALMTRNRFLLLDELSLGLSPLLVKEIFDVIVKINKFGISIFIVEQNVPMTLKVAQRAYILESGHIVGEGFTKDLLMSQQIKEAYLGMGQIKEYFREA